MIWFTITDVLIKYSILNFPQMLLQYYSTHKLKWDYLQQFNLVP